MKRLFTGIILFSLCIIWADNSGVQGFLAAADDFPPIADAGRDQNVMEGAKITLDGTGSSDPDHDIVSYEWKQTSGTTAVLSNTKSARTDFIAPDVDADGSSLTFSLKVTDSAGHESTDICVVNVFEHNMPPIADAGLSRTVEERDMVILDASGSYDPNDDIISYQWIQITGTPVILSDAAAIQAGFIAPDVNPIGALLMFKLRVTDSGGIESTDTCVIRVSWSSILPVADAGMNQTVDEGEIVTLDGSGSFEPDNQIISFNWSQTAGIPVKLSNTGAVRPFFKAPDVGVDGTSLTFSLTITDEDGLQAADTCIVNVSWRNTPPAADAGADQMAEQGAAVTLNGSDSSDSDKDISLYEWSQISGTPVTLSDPSAIQPTFTAPTGGDTALVFSLRVTDTGGLQNTDTCIVNVSQNNLAPVANAGQDQTVEEGVNVILNGAGSYDSDGTIAAYKWTQLSGIPITLSDSAAAQPELISPEIEQDETQLVFELVVTDNNGLKSADQCRISIVRKSIPDRDGDKIPDDQDAFPDDPNEWLDSDKDGIGNQADPDDDNDDMPDAWEGQYGLDPFSDDALKDLDNDGMTNIEEFFFGLDPSQKITPDPDLPKLSSPTYGQTAVSLTPELQIVPFASITVHTETEWQISTTPDFSSLIFDLITKSHLTSFYVPEFVLSENTNYYWRVRLFFNNNSMSEWSVPYRFTTLIATAGDLNKNGVPDDQDVDVTVDLDDDGTPDITQKDMLSVKTVVGNAEIGMKHTENIERINKLKSVDANRILDTVNKPETMPIGLIRFKLSLSDAQDTAAATVWLSDAVPNGTWYIYEDMMGWWNYSEYAEFDDKRKSLALEMKDGGAGDADGVENSIIIQLSGFAEIKDSESRSGGGSGDSCFIDAVSPQGG